MDDDPSDPSPNKVVMLGNEGVGKTTMFLRFKTGRFVQTTAQTRYNAEHFKEWTVKGKPVKMTLFDTAGMERYTSTIPPTYFRNAKIVLLVYSITDSDSISELPSWIENFSEVRLGDTMSNTIPVLVGNKLDLDQSRDVSIKRAKETAHQCFVPEDNVFELSASTGEGFDELFDTLALIMSRQEKNWKNQRKTIRAQGNVDKDEPESTPSAGNNKDKSHGCYCN